MQNHQTKSTFIRKDHRPLNTKKSKRRGRYRKKTRTYRKSEISCFLSSRDQTPFTKLCSCWSVKGRPFTYSTLVLFQNKFVLGLKIHASTSSEISFIRGCHIQIIYTTTPQCCVKFFCQCLSVIPFCLQSTEYYKKIQNHEYFPLLNRKKQANGN